MIHPQTHLPTEGGVVAMSQERESLKRPGNLRPAQWTILAYLAGDNDLEGAALEDIREMERVGSRPGVVELLVQVDRAAGYDPSEGDWRSTRRYHITKGTDSRRITSLLLADLGETNTGDPRVLEDFLRFGVRQFPARATALILWNHGSGFYVPPELLSREGAPSRTPAESPGDTPAQAELLFHHARAAAPARPGSPGDRL